MIKCKKTIKGEWMKKIIMVLGIVLVIMLLGIFVTNHIYYSKYRQEEIKSYDCCDVPLDENGYPEFSPFAPCKCNYLTIFEKLLIILGK